MQLNKNSKRMKRILTCLLIACISSFSFAQTANEIAQFSQIYNLGTARSIGMNGAAGALHSEYGAININPASLATFQNGLLMLSPAMNMNDNKSDYQGQSTSDSRTNFILTGAGIVYSFENGNKSSAFSRFNVSFGYNYNNSFNGYYAVLGNVQDKNQSYAQNLISTYPSIYAPFNNGGQLSANYQMPVSQAEKLTTSGFSADYTLSFATTYMDKILMGASASIGNLTYERRSFFVEDDASNTYKTSDQFDNFTSGIGFNFRLGVVYIPIDNLNIGIAAQSPTFYSLNAENNEFVIPDGQTRIELTNEKFSYKLRTPWRFTLSASYNFTSIATISFDYEAITNNFTLIDGDFNNMSQQVSENFRTLNQTISNDFKLAMNVRLGGEVRISNAFIRAGVAYIGAPNKTISDSFSGSLGAGYRFGDASIDAAYRYMGISEEYQLYNTSPTVKSSIANHLIALTFSYRF